MVESLDTKTDIIQGILEHYNTSDSEGFAKGGQYVRADNGHDQSYVDALVDQGFLEKRDALRDRFSGNAHYSLTVEGERALETYRGVELDGVEKNAMVAVLEQTRMTHEQLLSDIAFAEQGWVTSKFLAATTDATEIEERRAIIGVEIKGDTKLAEARVGMEAYEQLSAGRQAAVIQQMHEAGMADGLREYVSSKQAAEIGLDKHVNLLNKAGAEFLETEFGAVTPTVAGVMKVSSAEAIARDADADNLELAMESFKLGPMGPGGMG